MTLRTPTPSFKETLKRIASERSGSIGGIHHPVIDEIFRENKPISVLALLKKIGEKGKIHEDFSTDLMKEVPFRPYRALHSALVDWLKFEEVKTALDAWKPFS